jgi:hypothetical protein
MVLISITLRRTRCGNTRPQVGYLTRMLHIYIGAKNNWHAQLEKALDAQCAHFGGVEAHVVELCAERAEDFFVHDFGVGLMVLVTQEMIRV